MRLLNAWQPSTAFKPPQVDVSSCYVLNPVTQSDDTNPHASYHKIQIMFYIIRFCVHKIDTLLTNQLLAFEVPLIYIADMCVYYTSLHLALKKSAMLPFIIILEVWKRLPDRLRRSQYVCRPISYKRVKSEGFIRCHLSSTQAATLLVVDMQTYQPPYSSSEEADTPIALQTGSPTKHMWRLRLTTHSTADRLLTKHVTSTSDMSDIPLQNDSSLNMWYLHLICLTFHCRQTSYQTLDNSLHFRDYLANMWHMHLTFHCRQTSYQTLDNSLHYRD